jgi:hypothetical protein
VKRLGRGFDFSLSAPSWTVVGRNLTFTVNNKAYVILSAYEISAPINQAGSVLANCYKILLQRNFFP